jgi:hypothetical protein
MMMMMMMMTEMVLETSVQYRHLTRLIARVQRITTQNSEDPKLPSSSLWVVRGREAAGRMW